MMSSFLSNLCDHVTARCPLDSSTCSWADGRGQAVSSGLVNYNVTCRLNYTDRQTDNWLVDSVACHVTSRLKVRRQGSPLKLNSDESVFRLRWVTDVLFFVALMKRVKKNFKIPQTTSKIFIGCEVETIDLRRSVGVCSGVCTVAHDMWRCWLRLLVVDRVWVTGCCMGSK